jgi:hypothetical protein
VIFLIAIRFNQIFRSIMPGAIRRCFLTWRLKLPLSVLFEIEHNMQLQFVRRRIEWRALTNCLQRTCGQRGLTSAFGNLEATRAQLTVG